MVLCSAFNTHTPEILDTTVQNVVAQCPGTRNWTPLVKTTVLRQRLHGWCKLWERWARRPRQAVIVSSL